MAKKATGLKMIIFRRKFCCCLQDLLYFRCFYSSYHLVSIIPAFELSIGYLHSPVEPGTWKLQKWIPSCQFPPTHIYTQKNHIKSLSLSSGTARRKFYLSRWPPGRFWYIAPLQLKQLWYLEEFKKAIWRVFSSELYPWTMVACMAWCTLCLFPCQILPLYGNLAVAQDLALPEGKHSGLTRV